MEFVRCIRLALGRNDAAERLNFFRVL